MNILFWIVPVSIVLSLTFYSCERNTVVEPTDNMVGKLVGGYEITLIGGGPVDNGDGTYTWTWSVTNTNPGNGQNGTYQDLSHWNFDPGACFAAEDTVSAAAGTDLTNLSPNWIEIQDDPSMTCDDGTETFKFDFGTSGSVTSYYQLVLNKNYEVDPEAVAYWKAGPDCGDGIFDGIGCYGETDCTDETAWADGDRYVQQGNWATYTPYASDSDVPLYAGQTLPAGNVHFSTENNGYITIDITLYTNWSLQDVDEPVKIQDYVTAPSGNPSPGLFDYKFIYLTGIEVPANNYYGVHLDVQYCEE